jgi:hypothetical protein
MLCCGVSTAQPLPTSNHYLLNNNKKIIHTTVPTMNKQKCKLTEIGAGCHSSPEFLKTGLSAYFAGRLKEPPLK